MTMAPIRLVVSLSMLLLGTAAFQHPPAPLIAVRSLGVHPKSPSNVGLGSRQNDDADDDASHSHLSATRRSFVTRSLVNAVAAAASLSSVSPARAAGDSTALTPYDDTDYGFRLQVPSSWEKNEQSLSGRRKGIFFTDPSSKDAASGAIETFGFIAYTQVRDDFTSLSAFGSVEEVAQATIMPKGELAGQDTDASQMLSATKKNNAYYFDYVTTPVVPTEPGSGSEATKELKQQHFRTIFTLLPLEKSAGMTLVTITIQTTEERYAGMKGMFDAVVNSFGKIPSGK